MLRIHPKEATTDNPCQRPGAIKDPANNPMMGYKWAVYRPKDNSNQGTKSR